MKNRITTIEFPVFSDFIIHAEVTRDIEKAVKEYPCIADLSEEGDNDADAITVYNGGCICFIFLKPNVSIETIAHETFHAIEHMMEKFGVEFKGETPAYHLGFVTDRIFRFLRGGK